MTIAEVEAKQVTLEATIATALEASKALSPGTAEFDEAYGRYLSAKSSLAKIPGELAIAKQAEHAEAIKADCITIGAAIRELVVGLGLADKLGEPVVSVVWTQGAAGADGIVPEPVVKVNPKVTVKSSGGKREVKAGGHTMIGYPDGTQQSQTKFVLEFATEAEKASPEYKYPHTRVDSKPKFEVFCTAHNLTGYTYNTPGKEEAEPAS